MRFVISSAIHPIYGLENCKMTSTAVLQFA